MSNVIEKLRSANIPPYYLSIVQYIGPYESAILLSTAYFEINSISCKQIFAALNQNETVKT